MLLFYFTVDRRSDTFLNATRVQAAQAINFIKTNQIRIAYSKPFVTINETHINHRNQNRNIIWFGNKEAHYAKSQPKNLLLFNANKCRGKNGEQTDNERWFKWRSFSCSILLQGCVTECVKSLNLITQIHQQQMAKPLNHNNRHKYHPVDRAHDKIL